jgi:hypothetical protein
MFDVGIEVLDQNDQPLDLQHFVEPNEWPEAQVLNTIEPGATLKAIGGGITNSDIYARTSTIVPAAGKVFTANNIVGATISSWNSSQKLRIDFSPRVSTVSLRAYGATASGPSFGRLEAYDVNNNLIARFTTASLTNGGSQTMTVSRTQGDIDHVIAYGHLNSSVVLDTLSWGPASSPTTNTNGAYSLDYLPSGTYHIRVSPTAGSFVSTPTGGVATVSGGQTLGGVNFGIANGSPFHNFANKYNVDNDSHSLISASDALMVINYLNAHSGAEGEISPGDSPAVFGYIDVDGNTLCTPGDALDVINYINSHPLGGGEGEPARPAIAPSGAAAGSGQGEGEGQVPVPKNAADYYAQQPLHLLQINGTDQPCTCAACLAARASASEPSASPQATLPPTSASADAIDSDGLSPGGSSTKTILSISPTSLLLASTPTASSSRQSADLALTAKKQAGDSDQRLLAPEFEEALDQIAADVSQLPALSAARPLRVG